MRDVQCANISIMQQQYGFNIQSQVPFPYLPLASTFSKGNMIVKDLQGIVLFFVSSVDTVNLASQGLSGGDPGPYVQAERPADRGVHLSIRSSTTSRRTSPSRRSRSRPSVQGKFASAYAGKPVPADTAPDPRPRRRVPLTEGTESRVLLSATAISRGTSIWGTGTT